MKKLTAFIITILMTLCSITPAYATWYRYGEYLLYQSGLAAPVKAVKGLGYTTTSSSARFYTSSGTAYKYGTSGTHTYRQCAQVEDVEVNLVLSKSYRIYTYPFTAYKTTATVTKGTYYATKSAGKFFYISYEGGEGWVLKDNVMDTAFDDGYIEGNKAFGMSINTSCIVPASRSNRPGLRMAPKYVTIHSTSNTDTGANALRHAKYMQSSSTSWHFTVDDSTIYQTLPTNETGYHAGDGTLSGNYASVGIEICDNADGNLAKAEQRAARLAATILNKYNLTISALRQHHDWTGKDCPEEMRAGKSGSIGWSKFKSYVNTYLNQLSEAKLKLSRSNVTLMAGYSFKLTASKKGTSFSSTDATIATIDEDGTITGVSAGTCEINAVYENTDRQCKVTVRKASASGKMNGKDYTSAELSETSYTYSGKNKTPSVEIVDLNKQDLEEDTDYTVTYEAGRSMPGAYDVVITYKGDYEGEETLTYKIKKKTLTTSNVSVSGVQSFTYTGKKITQNPVVTYKDDVLDVSVKYSGKRKAIGTGKVIMTINDTRYTGTITKTYKIKPAKTSVSSLRSKKKKQFTVKYKAVSGGVKYQVAYKVKGGKWKYKTTSKTSLTVKKLKKGKTYSVRVRAYKNGVYAPWSETKTVKVK